MNQIEDMGETHDGLLKDTFDAMLTAPNASFASFFTQEQTRWEARKPYDFDELDSMATAVNNNMFSNKTWSEVDPKDAKIIALSTEAQELKQKVDISAPGKSTARSDNPPTATFVGQNIKCHNYDQNVHVDDARKA